MHTCSRLSDKVGDHSRYALLHTDFENAFILVSRRAFLRSTRINLSELYLLVSYTYGEYSHPLQCIGTGRWKITAVFQQGDPLVPILYALSVYWLMNVLLTSMRNGKNTQSCHTSTTYRQLFYRFSNAMTEYLCPNTRYNKKFWSSFHTSRPFFCTAATYYKFIDVVT